ncbi:unnamed protein product [Polarella glacialis]|uniref:Uncharacterized protein n=1 Tax=Polarella glacialis TaxID=89957 RepID=A0A813I1L1_POLGL|nr:unnamed protein product [Polarella glacialis]
MSPFSRCLLVLGLAGLPLVATQNTDTTKTSDTKSDSTDSSTVQDLVNLVVTLVKQSGSLTGSQKAIVSSLNMKLNSVSLPAVEAAHQKDQELVAYHASVLSGCDSFIAQNSLALRKMATTIATLKAEHELCESDRAALLAKRQTASSEFTANTVPQDESAVEGWLETRLCWYESFNATYTEFKVNETKADVEAKLSVANCTGELTGYTESYCSWAETVTVVTSTYTTCRSDALSLYTLTLATVQASATARKTEWAGLQRSQCLLNALILDDSGVSGELDACGTASSDTFSMSIAVLKLALYSEFLVDGLGTASDSSISCS